MPSPYIENRNRWEQLSEIDYLGAFANAWLSFNAWYRNAYDERSDRTIISIVKGQPNPVRNKLVPLITNQSEEGEQFRASIAQLHDRLENYHLHSGKGDEKKRITLTEVYLRDNTPAVQRTSAYGIQYEVIPGGTGRPARQVESKVTNNRGTILFQYTQPSYDFADLSANADFLAKLNPNQRDLLSSLYRNVNPWVISNLLNCDQTPISCGAYQFTCTADDLFAGFIEVIYLMRCTLFHGELVPCREAVSCYEPAYHLVRRFLQSIR